LGISSTEVAILRHPFFWRKTHHAKWTGQETHFATDTPVIHYLNLPVGLTLDRHGGTYRRTWGVSTVDADHRLIELLLVKIRDTDAR
jgi:hypothetical protein